MRQPWLDRREQERTPEPGPPRRLCAVCRESELTLPVEIGSFVAPGVVREVNLCRTCENDRYDEAQRMVDDAAEPWPGRPRDPEVCSVCGAPTCDCDRPAKLGDYWEPQEW